MGECGDEGESGQGEEGGVVEVKAACSVVVVDDVGLEARDLARCIGHRVDVGGHLRGRALNPEWTLPPVAKEEAAQPGALLSFPIRSKVAFCSHVADKFVRHVMHIGVPVDVRLGVTCRTKLIGDMGISNGEVLFLFHFATSSTSTICFSPSEESCAAFHPVSCTSIVYGTCARPRFRACVTVPCAPISSSPSVAGISTLSRRPPSFPVSPVSSPPPLAPSLLRARNFFGKRQQADLFVQIRILDLARLGSVALCKNSKPNLHPPATPAPPVDLLEVPTVQRVTGGCLSHSNRFARVLRALSVTMQKL